MATSIELHPAQAAILRTLLFRTDARFSELNVSQLSNDHFSFHINQLVDLKLISKNEKKTYQLTHEGKEFANRMDTENSTIEKQPKVTVLVSVTRKIGRRKEFLIHKRLKQPYYGFHGFVSGKVKWGESMYEAANRELLEETGLTGTPQLSAIHHRRDYSKEKQLLEDKVFFMFMVENPHGTLMEDCEGGKNIWMTKQELLKQPKKFLDTPKLLQLAESNQLVFDEGEVFVEKLLY